MIAKLSIRMLGSSSVLIMRQTDKVTLLANLYNFTSLKIPILQFANSRMFYIKVCRIYIRNSPSKSGII